MSEKSSEGNWICSLCGNSNYPSRTRCNMRKCGAPREVADAAMERGMGNIGNKRAPYDGGHGGYDSPYNVQRKRPRSHNPYYEPQGYRSGPPSYGHGPGGFDIPYGGPPMFDPGYHEQRGGAYGYRGGYRDDYRDSGYDPRRGGGGHYSRGFGGPAAGPRIETEDDNWVCPECGNINFPSRTHCNMRKCRAARPDRGWTCSACGNKNYPRRTHCNMRKCGISREESDARRQELKQKRSSDADAKIEILEDVWICPKCQNRNYAHRTRCNMRKCRAPRPPQNASSQNASDQNANDQNANTPPEAPPVTQG